MKKLSNAVLYNKQQPKIANAILIVLLSNPACPCNVIFSEFCYANNTYMHMEVYQTNIYSSYYDYGIVAQIMILIRYLCLML